MDPVVQLGLIAIVLTVIFRLVYTSRKMKLKNKSNEIQDKLEELRKKRDEE